ncbi:GNAT family N-acetyltransferase [Bernardetia sp. Wsw4-3y2]|uniref:GNAT family N-acetyltransferase n=1 Tax=Bernardetia sp. Wsw4-3y2 TaxID=3127471 RepID=UPI0030CD3B87
MSINYQKLTNQDLPLLKELIQIFEVVFEMEDFVLPNDTHLQSLLDNESMIFWVVMLEEHKTKKVIGGLRGYILPSVYYASSEMYLYDLGVHLNFQRKGIGTKLMENLKEYSKNLGYKELFVQADLEDEHAIDFYKKTGGKAADVIHFSYEL